MSKDKRTPGQLLWNCVSRGFFGHNEQTFQHLNERDKENWEEAARQYASIVLPDSSIAVDREHYERLKVAARRLHRFCESIVSYGGHVPESEALTEQDLA